MTLPPDDLDKEPTAIPIELRGIIKRCIRSRVSAPSSAIEAARQIVNAGYRKRRTIKTLEEFKTLSDLPKASVLLLSDNICVVQKAWDGTWYEVGAGRVYPILDWLPATVLYDPSEES